MAWIDIPGGFFQACSPLIRDSLGGIVNAFFHRAIDGQRSLGGIFVEEQPRAHATQGYHHGSGGHLAPQGNNESFAFALGGLPFPERRLLFGFFQQAVGQGSPIVCHLVPYVSNPFFFHPFQRVSLYSLTILANRFLALCSCEADVSGLMPNIAAISLWLFPSTA